MLPVRTGATTTDFHGPEGSDIGTLPAIVEDGTVTSVWEPDAAERSQLERGGRVLLSIDGIQPPVSLAVVGPDCANCGRPTTWSERLCEWVCSEEEIDADDHPLLS